MRQAVRLLVALLVIISTVPIFVATPALAAGVTISAGISGNPTVINPGTFYTVQVSITNSNPSPVSGYKTYLDLDPSIDVSWKSGWFYDGTPTYTGSATVSCTANGILDPSRYTCFVDNLAANSTVVINFPSRPGICIDRPLVSIAASLYDSSGNQAGGTIHQYDTGSNIANFCQLDATLTGTLARNTNYSKRIDVSFGTYSWTGTVRFNSGAHSTVTSGFIYDSPLCLVPGCAGHACSVPFSTRAECTGAVFGGNAVRVAIIQYTTSSSSVTNEPRNTVVFNANGKFQLHNEGQYSVQ